MADTRAWMTVDLRVCSMAAKSVPLMGATMAEKAVTSVATRDTLKAERLVDCWAALKGYLLDALSAEPLAAYWVVPWVGV
jgi:hypothetical protein